MGRKGIARTPELRPALLEAFARIDPEPVIALLDGMVSDARRARIEQVLAARLGSVTLLLDNLHDPHNGAAVLRSCDAFALQRVHALARTEPLPVTDAVSQGAERWVDAIQHPTAERALAALAGFELVAAHPQGALVPSDLAQIPRLALVLGNEHAGITPALERACRARVRVPMRGFVESLNVSVTAAVLLAHATAGRAGDLAPDERRRLYARALVLTVPRAIEILAAAGIVIDL